ncbi:hypothetical protein EDEG_02173 [Edhazardia aedis USNM 41457]|uniref:Uncharacterized protein n=1 Tax=Edhazardia aedis (strain USNM 41457) TaxID=1003232 RepID=J9D7K2_EDHAE|nr:hypothetical protein EDEG_02173 [Edhazardia aedis USNM 41457]|eukprot:EJW03499.1 hypothetical protein EDEG_02173 [Edhazardia aedis USNM 41457]
MIFISCCYLLVKASYRKNTSQQFLDDLDCNNSMHTFDGFTGDTVFQILGENYVVLDSCNDKNYSTRKRTYVEISKEPSNNYQNDQDELFLSTAKNKKTKT